MGGAATVGGGGGQSCPSCASTAHAAGSVIRDCLDAARRCRYPPCRHRLVAARHGRYTVCSSHHRCCRRRRRPRTHPALTPRHRPDRLVCLPPLPVRRLRTRPGLTLLARRCPPLPVRRRQQPPGRHHRLCRRRRRPRTHPALTPCRRPDRLVCRPPLPVHHLRTRPALTLLARRRPSLSVRCLQQPPGRHHRCCRRRRRPRTHPALTARRRPDQLVCRPPLPVRRLRARPTLTLLARRCPSHPVHCRQQLPGRHHCCCRRLCHPRTHPARTPCRRLDHLVCRPPQPVRRLRTRSALTLLARRRPSLPVRYRQQPPGRHHSCCRRRRHPRTHPAHTPCCRLEQLVCLPPLPVRRLHTRPALTLLARRCRHIRYAVRSSHLAATPSSVVVTAVRALTQRSHLATAGTDWYAARHCKSAACALAQRSHSSLDAARHIRFAVGSSHLAATTSAVAVAVTAVRALTQRSHLAAAWTDWCAARHCRSAACALAQRSHSSLDAARHIRFVVGSSQLAATTPDVVVAAVRALTQRSHLAATRTDCCTARHCRSAACALAQRSHTTCRIFADAGVASLFHRGRLLGDIVITITGGDTSPVDV